MALARSASGPGGLSINTGTANLFGSGTPQAPAGGGLFGNSTTATSQPAQQPSSLFGATTTSQSAGTLFGTTAAAQPAASGGLFGTAANTTQTAQAAKPSLFGAAAPAATQAQPSGGLFGAAAPAAQAQPSGGLFGSTAQTQQQPRLQTGGMFGAATNTQPQQPGGMFGAATNTQPQQPGGLFGASTAANPTQPQQTGGLFGNPAAAQPAQTGGFFGSSMAATQPQAAGGSFGASTNAAAAGNTGGLFGNMNQPVAAQSTGMFGQSQPAGGAFGGSIAQPATQTAVPGVRIDLSNIRSTTRFNDLQEDLQKQITALDQSIQKCMKDCDAVNAFIPSHEQQLEAIPRDVTFVARKSEGMQSALASDVVAINQLRELVNEDCDTARLSFRAIDNQKLPTQYHQAGLWSTRGQQTAAGGGDPDAEGNSDLIGFFSKTADEMDDMMRRFSSNVNEIELHIRGLQENMLEEIMRLSALSRQGGQGTDDRVAELAVVLRDFEESILKVASDVGGVREGVTELQLGDFIGNGTNGMR
ncbi:hypothetical protein GQ53DRAFT_800404 [Thozetella sp. PMI_491]|nr:hypothetical protein GQ53DRAFT_800404 [Thozetella sp. PMI_491]